MIFWYILFGMMLPVGFLCSIGALGYWRNCERVGAILIVMGISCLIATLAVDETSYNSKCKAAGGVVIDYNCMEPPTYINLS